MARRFYMKTTRAGKRCWDGRNNQFAKKELCKKEKARASGGKSRKARASGTSRKTRSTGGARKRSCPTGFMTPPGGCCIPIGRKGDVRKTARRAYENGAGKRRSGRKAGGRGKGDFMRFGKSASRFCVQRAGSCWDRETKTNVADSKCGKELCRK